MGTTLCAEATMSDEISLIAQRLRERLLTSSPKDLDLRTADLLAHQSDDGSWPDVDYDDQSRTHWKPSRHLSHLEVLARAYRLQSSAHYGDDSVGNAFRSGLQYWVDHHPTSDNWWFNVISTPRQLGNALLLMIDTLPADLIAATAALIHESGFTRTSANLVDEASNLLSLACATHDAELLRQAIHHIENEIRVTLDEGIQADDSFHQHGPQNMVISYGSVFTHIQASFAELFAGTAFAFSKDKTRILSRFILDGQQWFIRGRQIDYHAMGRGAFRGHEGAHVWNAGGFERISQQMTAADPERADEYRLFAARVSGQDPAGSSGPLGNKYFWRSDAMVQRATHWYASVRFHSTRVYATETRTNDENLQGYHLADGTYFVLVRGDEYHEVQPVWNYRRLPGLTYLDTSTPIPYGKQTPKAGNTAFVGGASDGTYGVSVMDYDKAGVQAKKAYFFTPEELVCLGASIGSNEAERVLTTLNQCRLRTKITLLQEDKLVEFDEEIHEGTPIQAIHHDGIAYVLLDRQRVEISAQRQTGSWREVEAKASAEAVAQDIFTCWIDHGEKPAGASYAYKIVPGIDVDQLANVVADQTLHVLSNTPDLQAVHFAAHNTTQAIFHGPGSLDLPNGETISADQACALLYRTVGDLVLLTVADPAQEHRQLILHLNRQYIGRGASIAAAGTRIEIDLSKGEYAGQSVVIPLTKRD
ncbi:MAG: chondroitin AC lyase [Candidatus Latescibacterota bacterium]|jgi:chondroitin AC lyase